MALPYLVPQGKDPLQGDIYRLQPTLLVRSRPLSLMRQWGHKGGYDNWTSHPEDDARPQKPLELEFGLRDPEDPAQGINEGEFVLAHGFLTWGMLLSHECEVENGGASLLMAAVLPIENLETEFQEKCRDGEREDVMWLPPQEEAPEMVESYVSFSRITQIHRDALTDGARHASLNRKLRRGLAFAAFEFFMRPPEALGE